VLNLVVGDRLLHHDLTGLVCSSRVLSSPTKETNGYLRVRCNGGLNQQRSAVGVLFL
jgi:hypothetical protein